MFLSMLHAVAVMVVRLARPLEGAVMMVLLLLFSWLLLTVIGPPVAGPSRRDRYRRSSLHSIEILLV